MLAFIQLPRVIDQHLPWWIAGLVIVLGLLVYGLKDVLRFSPARAWAISSVSFQESIRRRVLWITPLAILGVIIVSQLQKAVDPQDAVRQTIKFCLFATGLVVVVSSIILACTNLPREIDSRVIYTVVTKPTTRLEIVVGKVLGFARVSAAILLIMGVFTYAYMHLRSWRLMSDVRERLDAGTVDPTMRKVLEHYQEVGLLTAQTLEQADDLQVWSRIPEGDDPRRFMFGGEGDFLVPFRINPRDLIPPGAPEEVGPGAGGLVLRLNVGYEPSVYGEAGENPDAAEDFIPPLIANPNPPPPTTKPETERAISVQFLNRNMETLVSPNEINDGKPIPVTDRSGATPIHVMVSREGAIELSKAPAAFLSVSGATRDAEFFAGPEPAMLIVPSAPGHEPREIRALPDPRDPGRPVQPIFRGRAGSIGQQLRGASTGKVPVAVYKFRNAPPQESIDGKVPFEVKFGIERSGADPTEETPTNVEFVVATRDGSYVSDPQIVNPESNRTAYFQVPVEAVQSGDFDVRVRVLTNGHYLGINHLAVNMVADHQTFGLNLFKSLLVLWMMSVLVVIIAVFCSTFLSWPIAIVLTLVILLGRWGVMQLGDATAPGIGNQIVSDLGFRDAAPAKTVSAAVERLAWFLNATARVLPDITQFAAIEDIERGVSIPPRKLIEPVLVLVVFGLPLLVLSYIFLRNKEVAP